VLGSLLLWIAGSVAAQQLSIAVPENVSGGWEASDGHGGRIGMEIVLWTHIDGIPMSLAGRPQMLDRLDVGLFRHRGDQSGPDSYRYFTNGMNGGATWDGHRLRLLAAGSRDFAKVEVDLIWDSRRDVWTGGYADDEVALQATLQRPADAVRDKFVGTWFDSKDPMNNCLHLAQRSDGRYAGWFDSIQIPGRFRYAKGLQPPKQSIERYGEVATVEATSPGRLRVKFGADASLCCSRSMFVSVKSDGRELVSDWLAGPGQASRGVVWRKMPSNSCVAAASEAKAR
jgi:hypothetical protein